MTTFCVLGRQPELGLAELEALYGTANVQRIGDNGATVDGLVDFSRLGGSVKSGEVLGRFPGADWKKAFRQLPRLLPDLPATLPPRGKIKLGASLYGFTASAYDINGEVLRLKKALKSTGRSVRAVPNETAELSSAQTFHNHLTKPLGLELALVRNGDEILFVRITHVQDIDRYRIRDRERPKRDAFVGMLPPKLAQIIVNLAVGELESEKVGKLESWKVGELESWEVRKLESSNKRVAMASDATTSFPEGSAFPAERGDTKSPLEPSEPEGKDGGSEAGGSRSQICVLDPFCGTGVILQEALLMGYDVYGSDVSPKMIDYTTTNLAWLEKNADVRKLGSGKMGKLGSVRLEVADATDHIWRQPVTHLACEGYLGQPLGGQQPSEEKIRTIVHDTNTVMRGFLKNISSQLATGTRLCIAMPAWYIDGREYHLPVLDELTSFGFMPISFASAEKLVYRREDQQTARELVVLEKTALTS